MTPTREYKWESNKPLRHLQTLKFNKAQSNLAFTDRTEPTKLPHTTPSAQQKKLDSIKASRAELPNHKNYKWPLSGNFENRACATPHHAMGNDKETGNGIKYKRILKIRESCAYSNYIIYVEDVSSVLYS